MEKKKLIHIYHKSVLISQQGIIAGAASVSDGILIETQGKKQVTVIIPT